MGSGLRVACRRTLVAEQEPMLRARPQARWVPCEPRWALRHSEDVRVRHPGDLNVVRIETQSSPTLVVFKTRLASFLRRSTHGSGAPRVGSSIQAQRSDGALIKDADATGPDEQPKDDEHYAP
jgi:hypothetical protein